MILKVFTGLFIVRPLVVYVFAKALQFAWNDRFLELVAAIVVATFLIERNSAISDDLHEEAERLKRL